VSHDMSLAVQVARDDNAVDQLCDSLQRELIDKMREDPTLVEQATRLLLVARTLERTADHATNIVEQVYYVETGEMRQLGREEHIRVRKPDSVNALDHHDTESATRDADVPLLSTNGIASAHQAN
jgi:phosphate uptake regulator